MENWTSELSRRDVAQFDRAMMERYPESKASVEIAH